MCGRFLNRTPASETARILGVTRGIPNYPARYNIAPTQDVLAVRFNREDGERHLDALRWGLVPHWAKDLSIGTWTINARAETIAKLPTFRDAFAKRRCIIPADAFYEWRKDGKTKTPYAIVPNGEPCFAFAGLWDNWRDRAHEGCEWIRTCAIVTGAPNELVAPIHDRMPVILDKTTWAGWLGEEPTEPSDLLAMLRPYPADKMRAYPISTRVNRPLNDDPGLIKPMQAEGGVMV